MENYKKKATALISNLMFEYKADPTVVPHYPQKCEIMKKDSLLFHLPLLHPLH